MPTNILVPSLGESIIEATVARWLKKEGEPVATGEPLVELETDKVNLDVGAERDGVLSKIERQEGEDVKVGEVLGVIDEKQPAPQPEAGPSQPEAAKTAPENVSPETAPSQTPVSPEPPQIVETQPTPTAQARTEPERVTPVARRVAEEHGVNPSEVAPSHPGARVTRQDVQNYLGQRQPQPQAPVVQQPQPVQIPTTQPAPQPVARPIPTEDREERLPMSRRRRTIAQRLLEATQTTAMLTTFNEADMSEVMQIRKRRKDEFRERFGVGLGIASFFVKASVIALKEFPMVNAEIEGDSVVYKHYYDIGVAVGAAEGLVVPVIRGADQLTFADIEKKLADFVSKTKDGSLSLEDLRGGTFTITNGGVFGSLLSTPILNPPQVGILGLHKIEERPIALNGQVVIRPMMYLALSYDHRLVDGREAVQFLVRIKEVVENPEIMLLEN